MRFCLPLRVAQSGHGHGHVYTPSGIAKRVVHGPEFGDTHWKVGVGMGGVYGDIDSREGFVRMLGDARDITRRLLELQPENSIIERVAEQLDAMQKWSAEGREPTPAERERIQIGVIAVRELDAEREDESGQLAKLLFSLNNYFDDWPTDDAAASATDADYWKKFGL